MNFHLLSLSRMGADLRHLGRVFNLNDPRWGRDGRTTGRSSTARFAATACTTTCAAPAPPPRKPEQGPPDLDELWRDFNRRLGKLFGNGGGNAPRGP